MKHLYILFITLTFSWLSVNSTYARHSVFLIDKSPSALERSSDESLEKLLAKIVSSEVKKFGDALTISFIYEFSSNIQNRKTFFYDVPVIKEAVGNKIQRRKQAIAQLKSQKAYRKKWYKQVLNYIRSHNLERTQSDLFGTFLQLHDLIRANHKITSIWYYSDMVPCSKEFRYYCNEGKVFSGLKEVREAAQKDLEKAFSSFSISKDSFKGIEKVNIYLLQSPLSTRESSVYIPRYWSEIYQNQLGITTHFIN